MQPLRIAIVGAGAIAQRNAAEAAASGAATVAGVFDINTKVARDMAKKLGTTVFTSYDEVVGSRSVDAVLMNTPHHVHRSMTEQAAAAGKHVLVEKPLALTSEGAARVIQAADKADRTLMVAMNNRYRPDVVALKPFISGGELGDVFFMKGAALNKKVRHVRPTWRHTPKTAGGGALIDLGVQTLDLCLWLLDYPQVRRVHAHAHPGENMDVEDAAIATFELDGGRVIYVEVTWSLQAQRDRHYLQLLATRGSAAFPPLAVSKEVEQGLLDVTPPMGGAQGNLFTAAYRQQLRDFVDTARGARPRELPHEQVELMRLIELAYQSIRERRVVEVDA